VKKYILYIFFSMFSVLSFAEIDELSPEEIEAELAEYYNVISQDDTLSWVKEQDDRKGEIPSYKDIYRICHVFGRDSLECSEITTRFSYKIPFGRIIDIKCGNRACTTSFPK